jgi:exodeoxyribonuclease III
MKIVSWNIRQGGGNRIPRILDVIIGHGADTVALTEVSPDRIGELCTGLERLGYTQCHAPKIPPRERGVLIASKAQFDSQESRDHLGLPHYRWAEVRFSRSAFTLVCSYFPATGPAVKAFWPRVHLACSELRKQQVLLVGDLNSGQTAFDAQHSSLSGDPWFSAMPLLGFTDLWRLKHGARLDYTWFSQRAGKNLNGFRIDHAFGTQSLRRRVRACEYSHSEREARISDHSSIVISVQ